jgi:RNA polymerase sigma factor (sigma-70 family)
LEKQAEKLTNFKKTPIFVALMKNEQTLSNHNEESESVAIILTPEQQKAFDEELLPLIDAVYNFAYNLTHHDENAQDLVQNTYLKAFRSMKNYAKGTNAKAWLFTILKNTFINEYRKLVRQPRKVDYDEVLNHHQEDDNHSSFSSYVDLREEMIESMMGDEVTIAISELPDDFRIVILLCDIEECSYEEIAEITQIPIGTVRSRLHRARNMLKEKLRGYAVSLGYEEKR